MLFFNNLPTFTRVQRAGIVLLLVLIVGLQIVIHRFDNFISTPKTSYQLSLALQKEYDSLRIVTLEKHKKKIFPFNPNYLTDYKGYFLGMNLAEIDRVLAYRKQGKFFNSKQDFKQISGISDSLFQALKPYIKIPEFKKFTTYPTAKNTHISNKNINLATAEDLQTISGIGKVFSERIIKYRNSIGGFTNKKQLNKVYGLEPEVIQKIWQVFYLKSVDKSMVKYIKKAFNTAGETDLQEVNGIGEKLSKRIVKYRDKLGGFAIKEQLNDVYGLKPEVVERVWQQFEIKNPNQKIIKISLNDANIKELAENPYISYQLAKKIVSYRTLHGAFHNFADLLEINDFPKTKFKQITLFLKL